MFKDIKLTEMDLRHFGVGSTFGTIDSKEYLVVGHGPNQVHVIDLKTMNCISLGKNIRIADLNFFTSDEARKVVEVAGDLLHYTFTDFTLNPIGLKGIKERL